ncbi:MAG: group III truncated hemoglobin [Parasphingorhabdus sp.]|uniref:group III truncated hemoglobin n=1 Tax=Parasphingorhabdus sp. TaxID=2709688 RepID=UPI003000FE9C
MAHPDSIAAREEKAHHAAALGITEERITEMVDNFYGRIRKDALLGPIFSSKISNWPVHLARMVDFWTSIAIESGRFRGNPMIKHIAIPDIEKRHFDHWLTLFEQTLEEIMPQASARQFLLERAQRIAESLTIGISIHRDGLPKPPRKKEMNNVSR